MTQRKYTVNILVQHIIVVLISTFLYASCQPPSQLTEQQRIKITEEVNTMLKNYFDDIRNDGLMAEFNYLDSSDQFFWVPPGFNSAISYDSVATILKGAAPHVEVENVLETLKVHPLSAGLANYTLTAQSATTDDTGKVATVSLVESGIVIKRKSGWKLLSGQTAIVH